MEYPSTEFWKTKPMEEMTQEEWEMLCDGCGKCCAHKLEDDEGHLYQTDVCCRYFDQDTCQCKQYSERFNNVPDCLQVTPELARDAEWLPKTCAYRLLAQGQALPEWHPLVTGNKHSVHNAGISLRGKVISEEQVQVLEEHIIGIVLIDDVHDAFDEYQ